MNIVHKTRVAILGALLALSVAPASALAVTQEEVDAARAQLNSLGAELAQAQSALQQESDELERIRGELVEKREQYDATDQKLSDCRAILAERVSANYKSGGVSVLSILLGSSSIEEFIGNIYYADKVARQDAATIAQIEDLEQELITQQQALEAQQAEKEESVAQTTAEAEAYDAMVADAAAYFSSLDAQLQQQLIEEAQREQAEAAEAGGEDTSDATAAIATITNGGDAAEEVAGSEQQGEQNDNNNQSQNAPQQPAAPTTGASTSVAFTSWNTPTGTAHLAARVAGSATPSPGIVIGDRASGIMKVYYRSNDPTLQAYFAIMDAVCMNHATDGLHDNRAYASCHQASSAIIRATVDPDFAMYNMQDGMNYLQSSPKWTYIGMGGPGASFMQPGDVCINSVHTEIYVSNQIARMYWPNTDGNTFQASFNRAMYPQIFYDGTAGWYQVWRCTSPGPGVRNFINVDAVLASAR